MKNKFVKIGVAGVLAASMTACSNSTQTPGEQTQAPEGAGAQVYEVTGNGYGGEMNLKVTIDNQTITDIELVDSHETNVVIDRAFPVIRERILEANSPVVDSVSAATFSSYGVKSAVADAMRQAGMEVEEITMTTQGPEKEAVSVKRKPVISSSLAAVLRDWQRRSAPSRPMRMPTLSSLKSWTSSAVTANLI